MMRDKVYKHNRYVLMYGNVWIYFFISDNDNIRLDVMHQFYDKNGEQMQNRVKTMMEINFDWSHYDPKNKLLTAYDDDSKLNSSISHLN